MTPADACRGQAGPVMFWLDAEDFRHQLAVNNLVSTGRGRGPSTSAIADAQGHAVLFAGIPAESGGQAGRQVHRGSRPPAGRPKGREGGGARPSLTDGRLGWGTAQVALDEPVRQALLDRLDAPPRGLFKEVRGLTDHS